jgi:RNA polymerase sigma-70 factor (ECF subfamily)
MDDLNVDTREQEADWARRAQAGEFEPFEQLVIATRAQVYTLGLRVTRRPEDADEVVQETYLAAIEHIEDLRDPERFRSWIMGIATNQALMLLRKRRGSAKREEGSDRIEDVPRPEFIADWSSDPDRLAQQAETRQVLDAALDTLDEKYRSVFVLRDIEGMTTAETAAALDISVSNAKVRLLRARLALREEVTRRFGDEETRVVPGHHHGGDDKNGNGQGDKS